MRNRRSMVEHQPTHRLRSLPALSRAAALMVIGTTLLGPATARTAELQLRPECRCRGPVVTLGDVADVLAADSGQAEALAALELFPAPPPGTKRFLRLREIQDLLLIRGVSLLEHRISGASQVVVLGAGEEMETVDAGPLPLLMVEKAERRVREAVEQYLEQHVSDAERRTVDVKLDDAQARRVASAKSEISVRGGTPPWVGIQRFEVTFSSAEGPVRFDLDTQIALPLSVVVAARSLPRGAVIRAAEVQLQSAPAADRPSDGFHAIDEVVGQQTARAIPAGNILDRNSVRQPLLVRRGEVITVYARSAGIRVRSTARAREDGSLGDLIEVESLLNRAAYFARVSGIQEVEVYARATQADQAAAADDGSSAKDGLVHSDGKREQARGDEKPRPDPRPATRGLGR